MAETATTVKTASQTEVPNVTEATPAATIRLRKGPNTYRGEVAGSPPPASAPWSEFFSLYEIVALTHLLVTAIPWVQVRGWHSGPLKSNQ
jgi:hypothetical protein